MWLMLNEEPLKKMALISIDSIFQHEQEDLIIRPTYESFPNTQTDNCHIYEL